MKRFALLLLLMAALSLFAACDVAYEEPAATSSATVKTEEPATVPPSHAAATTVTEAPAVSTAPPVTTAPNLVFSFATEDTVLVLDGESASLTLALDATGEYGAYRPEDAVFSIVGGSTAAATVDGNTLTVTAVGTVTVKAMIAGVESTDTVTLSVVPSNGTIAGAIGKNLRYASYLGGVIDLGLTPEIASLYSVEGGEEYARIREDGKLEFVGIRTSAPLRILGPSGDVVYAGMLTNGGWTFSTAIREALYAEEKISTEYTDVPHSLLAQLESLTVSEASPYSAEEYRVFSYLTGLRSVTLSEGTPIYDLAFLRGLPLLESIAIHSCGHLLPFQDEGMALYETFASLPSLAKLSIIGSFDSFTRDSYDFLATRVREGRFVLEPFEGVTVDAATIDAFSETVFYSIEEYAAHLKKKDATEITPAEGFSHAVFVLGSESRDARSNIYLLETDKLSLLELYSTVSGRFYTPVYAGASALTLNLYSYHIALPYGTPRAAIRGMFSCDALTLTAMRGLCTVEGGAYRTPTDMENPWDWVHYVSGEGINLPGAKVTLKTHGTATLQVLGGDGYTGADGVIDEDNFPDKGAHGGNGGIGLVCHDLTLNGTITIRGGRGGMGGKGADAPGGDPIYDAAAGRMNGADGGTGGNGGAAVACQGLVSYHCNPDLLTIEGGLGGNGGAGGAKKLAGSPGETGAAGIPGEAFS